MFKKIILTTFALSTLSGLFGQEVWTLERCIQHAQSNNLQIKQSNLQVKNEDLTNQQNKNARLPSVSAGSNLGFNFGRSVNPSTYQFENRSSNFNAWSVRADVPIYSGGRLNNRIKQSGYDVEAAKLDAERMSNDIALQIASSYLQILLNEEQLENNKKRIKLSQDQLSRIEKQIKAGSLAQNSKYETIAQIARNEQQIVVSENSVALAYLTLKSLLQLDPDYALRIEKPNFNAPLAVNTDVFNLKTIFNQALNGQPQIRAGELRIKSAEVGVSVAKAGFLPTLNASVGLNTNYSNAILDFSTARFVDNNLPVKINGTPSILTTPSVDASTASKKSYGSQIGDNFGQSVSFSLQIPIFEQGINKINVERANLNVQQQILVQERAKQQLKNDIQTAIANARASQRSFDAAQKSLEALKAAFEATEKRFSIGGSSSFELSQAKLNLDASENDVVFAKYDFLFKLKIVEFYQGKSLNLK
ncbi:MAG: hypothetical protein RL757_2114 [Bacteroidota bacterium]|jgi:outer membrane protein